MPRLKLPSPAKRHARRLKHADRIGKQNPHANRTLVASMGYARGYDHALRDVHEIRQVEARARWRRSWRIADTHRLECDQLRARIAELEKQLAPK